MLFSLTSNAFPFILNPSKANSFRNASLHAWGQQAKERIVQYNSPEAPKSLEIIGAFFH
jgi:hypothetical protein